MIEAFMLGIVQGITEFLPISSTAHLILFPWFFNWSGEVDTLTFDIALHAGTLLAVLACFWKDWLNFITKKQRIFFLIFIGSLPAGIAGFLLNDFVEAKMRNPIIIIFTLIIVGILMLIAEKAIKYKEIEKIGLKEAIIIGIAQAFAIIPGVSRSGITIAAGLFSGMYRDASAKFSFLLSTPIIAGATLLHSYKAFSSHLNYNPELFLTGIITSSITGFLAIKFLLRFLKKYPMNIFVYYRFILAVVIIAGIWLKG
ncbi:MAG: undecaprenyl-diphosphate phosphatase [Nitrospirae bacterium]|nr:undecaprenyl-diphosphate phosphatase [Nitrospirota bacterium]